MGLADILLPYQKKFIFDSHKKKLWVSARQIGKSFALSYTLSKSVLSRPNSLGICVSTGARAASELLQKCLKMAQAVKILSDNQVDFESTADSIRFNNGSKIISLPNNPEACRGYSASIICVDECAFIEKPEAIFQAIAPTLTRDPNAQLIVTSTPAGMNNYFYDLYSKAGDDWYVQETTIEQAIADGLKIDIEDLKKLCPDEDVFAQEYMCQFSSEYGAFIDTNLLEFVQNDYSQGRYVFGMDIGRIHDRTSIVILRVNGEDKFVEDVVQLNKCEYEKQIEILKSLNNRYRFSDGLIDAGGIGSAVAERINKTVNSRFKGIAFTAANKTQMYEYVRSNIFEHKLKFNEALQQLVLNDMSNVKRVVNECGKVSFVAGRNSDGHSDMTSALVLALEACHKNPENIEFPIGYRRMSLF